MDSNRFRRRDYSRLPTRQPATPPPISDGSAQQPNPQPTSQPTSHAQASNSNTPQYTQLTSRSTVQPSRPQPVWAQPRSMPATAPTTVADAGTTINVNVSLPKLTKPRLRVPRLSKRSRTIIAVVLIAALVLAAATFAGYKFMHRAPQAALTTGAGQTTALANPSFTPVAPSEKSQLASASSAGTGFDGARDVYSYNDTISGTGITVSQQPLPAGSASPQAAIDKVAKSIGATTPVNIPNGTKGYLADSHSGNQVVVFTIRNLLVFIQSPFTHTAGDYQLYIANLK